jgi:hypothetical protein
MAGEGVQSSVDCTYIIKEDEMLAAYVLGCFLTVFAVESIFWIVKKTDQKIRDS